MKKLILPLIASAILISCGGNEDPKTDSLVDKSEQIAEDNQAKIDSTDAANAEVEQNATAINLWPKLSIQTNKDGKLKWVKSISFGRQMTVSRDTVIGKRTFHYAKIVEGTEGWVNAYCVAKNAKVGIVIAPSKIYKEPDPMSLQDNGFEIGEIVVVYDEMVGSYYQFVTQEKKSKGYLKSTGAISTDEKDLEAGSVFKNILAKEIKDQTVAFEEFLENEDYKNSVFGKKASELLEEGIEEEVIEQITDSSNTVTEEVEETVAPANAETEEDLF